MPTIISLKTTADKIGEGLSKDAALKALKSSVESALKTTGKFDLKLGGKQGWVLDAKIVSLATDDPDAPKKLSVTIAITCTYLGGATKVIKASNGGAIDGFNAKKLDAAAADLIDAVVADQLDKGGKLVKEMEKAP